MSPLRKSRNAAIYCNAFAFVARPLPECEWIDESSFVRAGDAFVDADLDKLGFEGVVPEVTGPASSCSQSSLRLDHALSVVSSCEAIAARQRSVMALPR